MPTVQLGELADIKVVSEAESISRTNGEDSIGVQIVKAADANTVEVVNGVKDAMNNLKRNLGLTVITTLIKRNQSRKLLVRCLIKPCLEYFLP